MNIEEIQVCDQYSEKFQNYARSKGITTVGICGHLSLYHASVLCRNPYVPIEDLSRIFGYDQDILDFPLVSIPHELTLLDIEEYIQKLPKEDQQHLVLIRFLWSRVFSVGRDDTERQILQDESKGISIGYHSAQVFGQTKPFYIGIVDMGGHYVTCLKRDDTLTILHTSEERYGSDIPPIFELI